MNTIRLVTLAAFSVASAFAQELTLSELARRPELLPAQVTIKQAVRIQGRPPLPAGQKLTAVSMDGNNIKLESPDGRARFPTRVDNTDVLAVAQETWATLSPEQRALPLAAMLQRKELWTYRVTLKQAVHLDASELKPGDKAILVGVEGNELLLADANGKFLFNVRPGGTDFVDSARKLLVDPDAFPSRVSQDLEGRLINPATGAAVALDAKDEPRYYAFYRGAGWCGPCRQFSPSLVKFYRAAKPKYPGFELFFFSADKTPADLRGYAKEMGFAWNTIPQSRHLEMQVVNRLFTDLIPQLVVIDKSGNVLIDSARIGTAAALKQFEALLKKG
jgi:thiol-disulfide isomerase/thioredoxin